MADVTKAVLGHCRRNGWVISFEETRGCGASSRQLRELVRSGILSRAHPGVYVASVAPAGHEVGIRAALKALRASDPARTSAASHRTAAWLQGITDSVPAQVFVTTTAEHRRRLAGVTVHTTKLPLERRPFRGIPCTLPARTLVDLAATATPAKLADAGDRAHAQGILRTRDLEAEIRKGHRRGTDQLRRCLEERGLIGAPTPSVLESRMARVITRYRLPLPRAELIAGRDGEYRIDYTNPARRMAVELYGYTWHHSPGQMASDHARQRQLTIEGWTVLVFTWQDVTNQPDRVAREIRLALGRRAAGARAVHGRKT